MTVHVAKPAGGRKRVGWNWLEDIEDWCISRQLWWGHQVPVFKDESNNFYCGKNAEYVKLKYSLPENIKLTQETDVLDTWFSSELWPFATLGWPEKTQMLDKFFPTDTLVTGFDIIFFWVARMIMASYTFQGQLPFKNVFFTGLIRDSQGRKLSKSLGNSPDCLHLLGEYGADGVRFGLLRIAPTGSDIRYDEDRVKEGRNFATKLWNAARFCLMIGTMGAFVPNHIVAHMKLA